MKTLIFIIIITLISNSVNQQCQKVKCDEIIEENVCILPKNDTSIFQLCPKEKICQIISEEPIDKTYCENIKLIQKKYPGLQCNNNTECFSNKCINNICEGIKEGNKCNLTSDCEYGNVCRKENNDSNYKICTNPIKENDKENKCYDDSECDLDYGCLNNKCIKYFSLNEGESIGISLSPELSLCQSGFSDENGVCKTLTLQNELEECNDICEYIDTNGNIIKKKDNCLCGYNELGKKYCLLGSGNSNYTKYINLLKKYRLNNKNCHHDERNSNGCIKDIIENKKETIEQIHKLINAKYWANLNYKLYNSPVCVINIELPDFDYDVEPKKDEKKCAKYKCVPLIPNNYCASSKFENQSNINVEVADVCDKDNYCYLNDKKPNEFFYEEKDQNAKCMSFIKDNLKRYPGEDCNLDSDCIYPIKSISDIFHKCDNNKCTGLKKEEKCNSNDECIVGLYCDISSGKCKEQNSKGNYCTLSTDCKNNLLCYENKCQDVLFGLSEGKIPPKNEKNREKYCKYNIINSDGVCIKLIDQVKGRDDEYIKCDRNGECVYSIIPYSYGLFKKNCECGYNNIGQGYCPKFHDYFENDWNNYFEYLKSKYDNKCHTENRYNCYLKSSKDDLIKKLNNKLNNGHLFYNSEPCMEKVLNSINLKINNILIFIFLSILI